MRPSTLLRAAMACAGLLGTPVWAAATAPATYDATHFIGAMIAMKSEAVTCNAFVKNSPAKQMAPIDAFFTALGQTLPADLVDHATRSSLSRFVRPQAAALCNGRLIDAYAAYYKAAAAYQQGKPAQWPDAPAMKMPKWCAAADCSDIQ